MKIAKYKVVAKRFRSTNFEKDLAEFSKKVEGEISMGWQPLGGVCNGGEFGDKFVQAMVKYY